MARSTVLRHTVTAGVLQVQRRVKSWQHVASELCVCWHVRLAKNQTEALVGLLGPSFFFKLSSAHPICRDFFKILNLQWYAGIDKTKQVADVVIFFRL